MARKKRDPEELDTRRRAIRNALRFSAWTLGVVASVFGLAWVVFQGDLFLSTDARFRLPRQGASAQDDAIRVRGIANASRAAVLRVFEDDRGRGISEVDLARRRMQLRTVDWVRDASVRRVWPNRLEVDIEERVPVAFIQVVSGISGSFFNPVAFKPMLIDADGIILQMRGNVPPRLPLLIGVREDEEVEKRRGRVLRMLRLLDELKDYRDRISEVDVSDPESLRVTYQVNDQQTVILVLGNERFLDRLNTFLRHYDGIRDRLPSRAILDVSLEGRITAIQPAEVTGR